MMPPITCFHTPLVMERFLNEEQFVVGAEETFTNEAEVVEVNSRILLARIIFSYGNYCDPILKRYFFDRSSPSPWPQQRPHYLLAHDEGYDASHCTTVTTTNSNYHPASMIFLRTGSYKNYQYILRTAYKSYNKSYNNHTKKTKFSEGTRLYTVTYAVSIYFSIEASPIYVLLPFLFFQFQFPSV